MRPWHDVSWDWHAEMMTMMMLGWIIGLLVIAALVWVFLRSRPPDERDRRAHGESPEDIVKRRYASGEIDSQQYERTLADLRR